MLRMRRIWEVIQNAGAKPVDGASLAAFRILFGLMMTAGIIRFAAHGWIERFFVKPEFTFKYWGFGWVELLEPAAMTGVFAVMGLSAFMVAIGFFYRFSILLFFVLFTYVELIDVSNYLNHYYLVSLLAFILVFLPANKMWSVDAYLFPKLREKPVQFWMIAWLRFQMGCVYFFAGITKFGEDWLIHAQPLHLWLRSRVETPFVGVFLHHWETALVMSWAGFLFDLTIVFWLLWGRSRPLAYAVLVVFHTFTNVFFAIGMFPVIMVVGATIFFNPDWPRRVGGGAWAKPQVGVGSGKLPFARLPKRAIFALIFCTIQFVMPWRHLAYPGNVLWTEEGMRWSWKVMIREKNGDVMYRVRSGDREFDVSPRRYLTADQEREFSGQPDMILQLAHHIANDHTVNGTRPEVRVDAWVAWNGRRRARIIDPSVDLARVEDSIWPPASWILAAPTGPALGPAQRL